MARKEPFFKEEVYLEILSKFDKPEQFYKVETVKRKYIFSKEQLEHIYDLHFNEEIRLAYLAYHFNVGIDTIHRVFKENNWKAMKYRDGRFAKRKYTIKSDFFEKIDTEEKAYWLGMLYADGAMIENNYCVKLELNTLDTMHIQKFLEDVGSNSKLHYRRSEYCNYKDKNRDIPNMVGAKLTNKQMFNDLCKLGCVPRKSKVLKFPSDDLVPFELKRHFIRGFTDGDGSINFTTTKTGKRKYKISWCGNRDMLNGVREYFLQIGFQSKAKVLDVKNREDWFTELIYSGNKKVRNIINFLYDEANVSLCRKHMLADEMNEYFDKEVRVAEINRKCIEFDKLVEKEMKKINKRKQKIREEALF